MTDEQNTEPGPPDGDELTSLLTESRAFVMARTGDRQHGRTGPLTWTVGVAAALILFAGGLGVGGAFAAKPLPTPAPAATPAPQAHVVDCYESATDGTPFTQIIWVTQGGLPIAAPALTSVGEAIPASPTDACSSAWEQFALLASLRGGAAGVQAQYLCQLRATMTGEPLPCPMTVPNPARPAPSSWVQCSANIPRTFIVVGLETSTAAQACTALGLTNK
ncbi:MAG TPA: hypothetical protein VHZ81_02795 [Galbitalea sp.]|jgi:hypothetical protein|nr:hypothetical protein [Galbitalea sp.]